MPRYQPKAAVIFNPVAGRGAEDLGLIRERLRDKFSLSVLTSTRDRDADACAAAAVTSGTNLVIAAGGDGTVSLIAGALVGSGVPLAIVPRGTSNSIARGLGIPSDLEGALETVRSGQVCDIDTASSNGRTMLLHACVGFHAATVGGTERDAKNRWGVLAYINKAVQNLRDLQPFQVTIETEAEIVRCRAVNVTVANVAPLRTFLAQGGGPPSPDDGMLDVTIVAATGIGDAVATGLHLVRSAMLREAATRDNVGYLSAQAVTISADPPQPLLIDGEAAGTGPLTVRCMSRNLRVLVPTAPARQALTGNDKLNGLPSVAVEHKAES